MGSLFEGVDHAVDRFVEDRTDEALQDARAELEIDVEVDRGVRPTLFGIEEPVVVQVFERAVGVFHVDAIGAVKRHF